MMMRSSKRETIGVQLGYAASPDGDGIVYARLRSSVGARLVRAAFRAQRFSGLGGREVAYAALDTLAAMLQQRGIETARFELPDNELVQDLAQHRDVPSALVLPYVHLRCTLNRFRDAAVVFSEEHDLTQRARAEIALHSAA